MADADFERGTSAISNSKRRTRMRVRQLWRYINDGCQIIIDLRCSDPETLFFRRNGPPTFRLLNLGKAPAI
ncbi:hypothetical protein [Mesorhizobium captivum]|uniref:hypothetical protein n=1 Tax=Mesorhizobium captivum TaxID=3072319 RepID=UPI002A246130|nr:hypothetical protein [Mesorhizobium sp. VK3C]MDX8450876.1 hypothetical protein [Mesorhizobium sp. VK3C]